MSVTESKDISYEATPPPPGNVVLQVSHCPAFARSTLDFLLSSCNLLTKVPVIALSSQATNWTMTAEALCEVQVRIGTDRDIVVARRHGRTLARQLGFLPTDLTAIATVISELAGNIVRYARCGEVLLKPSCGEGRERGLSIVAHDNGPGIPNVQRALQGGYSTSGSLGLGLSGSRRLMDEFEVVSGPSHGTVVTARKWLKSPMFL